MDWKDILVNVSQKVGVGCPKLPYCIWGMYCEEKETALGDGYNMVESAVKCDLVTRLSNLSDYELDESNGKCFDLFNMILRDRVGVILNNLNPIGIFKNYEIFQLVSLLSKNKNYIMMIWKSILQVSPMYPLFVRENVEVLKKMYDVTNSVYHIIHSLVYLLKCSNEEQKIQKNNNIQKSYILNMLQSGGFETKKYRKELFPFDSQHIIVQVDRINGQEMGKTHFKDTFGENGWSEMSNVDISYIYNDITKTMRVPGYHDTKINVIGPLEDLEQINILKQKCFFDKIKPYIQLHQIGYVRFTSNRGEKYLIEKYIEEGVVGKCDSSITIMRGLMRVWYYRKFFSLKSRIIISDGKVYSKDDIKLCPREPESQENDNIMKKISSWLETPIGSYKFEEMIKNVDKLVNSNFYKKLKRQYLNL